MVAPTPVRRPKPEKTLISGTQGITESSMYLSGRLMRFVSLGTGVPQATLGSRAVQHLLAPLEKGPRVLNLQSARTSLAA